MSYQFKELDELVLLVSDDLNGPTATHQLLYFISVLLKGEKLNPDIECALLDLAAYSRVLNAGVKT